MNTFCGQTMPKFKKIIFLTDFFHNAITPIFSYKIAQFFVDFVTHLFSTINNSCDSIITIEQFVK